MNDTKSKKVLCINCMALFCLKKYLFDVLMWFLSLKLQNKRKTQFFDITIRKTYVLRIVILVQNIAEDASSAGFSI